MKFESITFTCALLVTSAASAANNTVPGNGTSPGNGNSSDVSQCIVKTNPKHGSGSSTVCKKVNNNNSAQMECLSALNEAFNGTSSLCRTADFEIFNHLSLGQLVRNEDCVDECRPECNDYASIWEGIVNGNECFGEFAKCLDKYPVDVVNEGYCGTNMVELNRCWFQPEVYEKCKSDCQYQNRYLGFGKVNHTLAISPSTSEQCHTILDSEEKVCCNNVQNVIHSTVESTKCQQSVDRCLSFEKVGQDLGNGTFIPHDWTEIPVCDTAYRGGHALNCMLYTQTETTCRDQFEGGVIQRIVDGFGIFVENCDATCQQDCVDEAEKWQEIVDYGSCSQILGQCSKENYIAYDTDDKQCHPKAKGLIECMFGTAAFQVCKNNKQYMDIYNERVELAKDSATCASFGVDKKKCCEDLQDVMTTLATATTGPSTDGPTKGQTSSSSTAIASTTTLLASLIAIAAL